jgi:chemotaxis protein methyltransferase CheR
MDGIELGIVETRNIIRLINELYHYDFSDFALTSFKRRLENLIFIHNLKIADNLYTRIREDKNFFDLFLQDILVEPTEMFRDPSLWRLLRDEYLPQMAVNNSHIKVWFPMTVSGEELFSFLILLRELGIPEKCEIIVSYVSPRSKENINSGRIKSAKIEVCNENYKRYHGHSKFEDYYAVKDNSIYFDQNLYKDVVFIQQDLTFENLIRSFDLIFFRNQMLYFNQGLQDRILDIFYDRLSFNGYLIAGVREKVLLPDTKKILRLVDTNENIYQKK